MIITKKYDKKTFNDILNLLDLFDNSDENSQLINPFIEESTIQKLKDDLLKYSVIDDFSSGIVRVSFTDERLEDISFLRGIAFNSGIGVGIESPYSVGEIDYYSKLKEKCLERINERKNLNEETNNM